MGPEVNQSPLAVHIPWRELELDIKTRRTGNKKRRVYQMKTVVFYGNDLTALSRPLALGGAKAKTNQQTRALNVEPLK